MAVGYPFHARVGNKRHGAYINIAGCLPFWQMRILLYILSARHRDEFELKIMRGLIAERFGMVWIPLKLYIQHRVLFLDFLNRCKNRNYIDAR